MTYTIHPKRLLKVLTVIGSLIWVSVSGFFTESLLTKLMGVGAVLLITVVFALFRFSCEVNPEVIVYRLSFLKWTVFEKEIKPEEISEVKFFRVGMNEKAAVIKREYGWNVRLVVFRSHDAYDMLLAFCEVHDLDVVQTRNYLAVER